MGSVVVIFVLVLDGLRRAAAPAGTGGAEARPDFF